MYKIKVGNIYYFLSIIIIMIGLVGIYFLLKKEDKDKQRKILFIWAFINFAFHFIKQLFYLKVEYLYTSTLDNICSISTVVLPFIMMIKKETFIKDSVLFLSLIGGLAAIIYPTEIISPSKNLLSDFAKEFEAFRFYFCHFSLLCIPLLLGIFNIERIRLKVCYLIPIGLLLYLTIIFFNTGFLCITKLVTYDYMPSQEALFWDRNLLNHSFVFGPTDDMGKISEILSMLCPKFMKVDYLNISHGYMEYWPVIWTIVPAYIIFIPLYTLIALPFNIKKNK